ncbi:KGG domain-containing protein [Anaerofustis stercorihominis]|uniref:KGG domain-containing protein n=1 Tax=Anaerofustis stercorihominis TaxID=214853 RepID=UPI003994499B
MAGYDNIKDYGFDKLTAEEQREIASKGGKASVKARRKRKNIQDTTKMILGLDVIDDTTNEILDKFGVEDKDLQSLMICKLILKAINGDVKAVRTVLEITGESAKYQKQEDNNDNDNVLMFIEAMKND